MKGGSANGGESSATKIERKTVEKNRRIHMKNLCFKLSSLIPKDEHLPKDALSQHDQLDQGAAYIKKLRGRVERLKQRKKQAMGGGDVDVEFDGETASEFGLPVVEVRQLESVLEVVLIAGLKRRPVFYEVIAALEEEGAEVVNASFSVVGDKVSTRFTRRLFRLGLASRLQGWLKGSGN